MKLKISLSEVSKFKYLVAGLLVVLVIIIVVISLSTSRNKDDDQNDWIKNKSQDSSEIKDIIKALPYIDGNYRISYDSTNNIFVISYPGFVPFDQIELKTVLWFKTNTKYSKVEVKYGEVGGRTQEYNLSATIDDILKSNKYYQETITDSNYSEMEI